LYYRIGDLEKTIKQLQAENAGAEKNI
jgi:hypothetical protein